VHPTWFNDAQLSYTLIFTPPVEAAPVPGYPKGGKEVVSKEKEAPPVPYAMLLEDYPQQHHSYRRCDQHLR
jgi:hypothetical protein